MLFNPWTSSMAAILYSVYVYHNLDSYQLDLLSCASTSLMCVNMAKSNSSAIAEILRRSRPFVYGIGVRRCQAKNRRTDSIKCEQHSAWCFCCSMNFLLFFFFFLLGLMHNIRSHRIICFAFRPYLSITKDFVDLFEAFEVFPFRMLFRLIVVFSLPSSNSGILVYPTKWLVNNCALMTYQTLI